MSKKVAETIGETFLLWKLWRYILTNPLESITHFVLFLAMGCPFLWGAFRGEIVKTGAFNIVTVPASTFGVFIRSGFGAVGSMAVREDGTPLIYEEGTVTVEKVGTGLTLADVEAKQEEGE
jgi:hypothetical protein